MSSALIEEVLTRVVVQSLNHIAGLKAKPTIPTELQHKSTSWSWVKVVDPKPGTVVIGMDDELAGALSAVCLGEDIERVHTSGEIRDAEAELTHVIAARLAMTLLSGEVTLGVPRAGRGPPDLQVGSWVVRHFLVGSNWMAVFITGEALTAPAVTAHLRSLSTVVILPNAPQGAEVTPDHHFIPVQRHRTSVNPGDMPVTIGRYRIIDLLGTGGMGVVYKANHESLDRLVALKVMRPDLAKNQQFITCFLREGRSAAKIDHPNVVPVYDAGMENDYLYIAMRFVRGGDLASLLHRCTTLPEDLALTITQKCLEGLRAIGEAGMIHRDLKPANILLEATGVPRLADLGLASTLTAAELSQPGSPIGTPTFMAPEQARAALNIAIDIRCDIYAMGVTLFCMLCGQPPFTGTSQQDLIDKVLYQPTPDPRSLNFRISEETANLVMKATSKKPADRYQSPLEFQQAVDAVLGRIGQAEVDSASGKMGLSKIRNYWVRKVFGVLPPLLDDEPLVTV